MRGVVRGARVAVATAAVAVLALAALVGAAETSGAGASEFFMVTKTVIGTAPAGTTFTASISCTAGTPNPNTVSFNASGTPTSTNTIHVGASPSTCTVTETGTGGAGNVAYTCTLGSVGGAACVSSNRITVLTSAFSNGTINIVNTYLPPLTVSPSPATPGTAVTISGMLCTKAVFGGSASTGGSVSVTVGYPSPVTAQTTGSPSSGNWSVQVTVPPGTPPGSYPVNATCNDPVAYPAATSAVVVGVTAAFTG